MSVKGKKKDGKIDHFVSLVTDKSKLTKGKQVYDPKTILYFDDDEICVEAARRFDFIAISVPTWSIGMKNKVKKEEEEKKLRKKLTEDLKSVVGDGGELPEIERSGKKGNRQTSSACMIS